MPVGQGSAQSGAAEQGRHLRHGRGVHRHHEPAQHCRRGWLSARQAAARRPRPPIPLPATPSSRASLQAGRTNCTLVCNARESVATGMDRAGIPARLTLAPRSVSVLGGRHRLRVGGAAASCRAGVNAGQKGVGQLGVPTGGLPPRRLHVLVVVMADEPGGCSRPVTTRRRAGPTGRHGRARSAPRMVIAAAVAASQPGTHQTDLSGEGGVDGPVDPTLGR